MDGLTLLFIRHAEKPGEEWPGPGLRIDGQPDDKSLVIRGWQRAGAWAALFGSGPAEQDYPRPEAIYAAKPDMAGGPGVSQRPYDTVVPLSQKLQIPIIANFAKGEEPALAEHLVTLAGTVLICWEHKSLAKSLLPAVTGNVPAAAMPAQWDGERFDVVLRLDRTNAQWTGRQLFPRLLGGDTDQPL